MTTTTTWWVQPDDDAFVAAYRRERDRIIAESATKREARFVDAMITAQWALGFARPRPMSGVAR